MLFPDTLTNSATNIGVRQDFGTLGARNFENTGDVLYKSTRAKLDLLGTTYYFDDELPFDVASTSYSPEALRQLELYWNHGWIAPVA